MARAVLPDIGQGMDPSLARLTFRGASCSQSSVDRRCSCYRSSHAPPGRLNIAVRWVVVVMGDVSGACFRVSAGRVRWGLTARLFAVSLLVREVVATGRQ